MAIEWLLAGLGGAVSRTHAVGGVRGGCPATRRRFFFFFGRLLYLFIVQGHPGVVVSVVASLGLRLCVTIQGANHAFPCPPLVAGRVFGPRQSLQYRPSDRHLIALGCTFFFFFPFAFIIYLLNSNFPRRLSLSVSIEK